VPAVACSQKASWRPQARAAKSGGNQAVGDSTTGIAAFALALVAGAVLGE
jgi:hypothetical protein